MPLFLIIRAPPRDIEFPERHVLARHRGADAEKPEKGPHRHVLAEVWATQCGSN